MKVNRSGALTLLFVLLLAIFGILFLLFTDFNITTLEENQFVSSTTEENYEPIETDTEENYEYDEYGHRIEKKYDEFGNEIKNYTYSY